jgi:hypothetical protein
VWVQSLPYDLVPKFLEPAGTTHGTLKARITHGHVIVKPNLLIFKLLAGYGYLFFGYAPGPDLAWQVAVIESDPCISSENSYISKSRRARAGL